MVAPLAERHLDQVVAIERASFSRPWSREIFRAELHVKPALPLVAVTLPSDMVVAFLLLWLVLDEVEVQNLAVHQGFRRLGIGRYLLLTGLKEAARRGALTAHLEVRPSNETARRLYGSLGFRQVGTRPGYYSAEGEDALLLDCRIADLVGTAGEKP